MGRTKKVKVGDRIKAVFSVGVKHPLYNVPVDAKVYAIGGYTGNGILAKTINPVHYPENPEGILCFDENGKFSHYESTPAYDEIWDGWVDKIVA